MSGGIAYVWDIDGKFSMRCNLEMVELCKVEDKDDIQLIKNLLQEFKDLTGSVVAEKLINEFDIRLPEFVKVFPYDYQRVLKQNAQTVEETAKTVVPPAEPNILDIEETVADLKLEQKKVERALDKTRGKTLDLS